MSDFIAHLHDVFRLLGPITVKKMFGGYGIYREGLMFALVASDSLYLKADAESKPLFDKAHLLPFCYVTKDGQTTVMSYCQAPDSIFDDPQEAQLWGQRAWDAAVRVQAQKPVKNKNVKKQI